MKCPADGKKCDCQSGGGIQYGWLPTPIAKKCLKCSIYFRKNR